MTKSNFQNCLWNDKHVRLNVISFIYSCVLSPWFVLWEKACRLHLCCFWAADPARLLFLLFFVEQIKINYYTNTLQLIYQITSKSFHSPLNEVPQWSLNLSSLTLWRFWYFWFKTRPNIWHHSTNHGFGTPVKSFLLRRWLITWFWDLSISRTFCFFLCVES